MAEVGLRTGTGFVERSKRAALPPARSVWRVGASSGIGTVGVKYEGGTPHSHRRPTAAEASGVYSGHAFFS